MMLSMFFVNRFTLVNYMHLMCSIFLSPYHISLYLSLVGIN